MSFSSSDEERAIEVVTSLGSIPVDRQMLLSACAIAEVLSVAEEQAQAILVSLRDRELIEFRLQLVGGSLEGVSVPVNHFGAWFRLEPG